MPDALRSGSLCGRRGAIGRSVVDDQYDVGPVELGRCRHGGGDQVGLVSGRNDHGEVAWRHGRDIRGSGGAGPTMGSEDGELQSVRYWPGTRAGSSSTVNTDSRPVTCNTFRVADPGPASWNSPPRSRACRCAARSTLIPVESQKPTPDMSTISRAGLSLRAAISSDCSLGAV